MVRPRLCARGGSRTGSSLPGTNSNHPRHERAESRRDIARTLNAHDAGAILASAKHATKALART
eukprot:4168690-Pleurochrysis_carterae.AAC.2